MPVQRRPARDQGRTASSSRWRSCTACWCASCARAGR